MFGDLPEDVVEGRLAPHPHNILEVERAQLWNQLHPQFALPNREHVFVYELRMLANGARWAPHMDLQLWNRAIAMCTPGAIQIENRAQVIETSKLLDAKIQGVKLAFLLDSLNLPPLIKVRRGRYHTLLYIVYCCMVIDQNNFTLWKIGRVRLSQRQRNFTDQEFMNSPYHIKMMVKKFRTAMELQPLGFRLSISMFYNQAFHALSNSLRLNKMRVLHARNPNGPRNYAAYIVVDQANLNTRMANLQEMAWRMERGGARDGMIRPEFNAIATQRCWTTFAFDPLFPGYVQDSFAGAEDREMMWVAYQGFLARLGVLRAEHLNQLDIAWNEGAEFMPRNMRGLLNPLGPNNAGS
jgi:hypothetical protein